MVSLKAMTPIPVAFVVNNFDVGGLEKVVLSLVQGLRREDFTPYVVCLDGPGRLAGELGLPASQCLFLRKGRGVGLPFLRVDASVLAALAKFFRENQIALVHAHNLAPLVYGGLAARTLGWSGSRPRVLYTEHNQIYRATPVARLKFLGYLQLADRVATCSVDLQKFFRKNLRLRRPIDVLYNGIDGSRYAIAPTEGASAASPSGEPREDGIFRENAKEFVFLTAAVLSEQKGVRYLLEAAALLQRQGVPLRFVIAGEGPCRKSLEAQARHLGVESQVTFLGYRSDVPALLAQADGYCLPSLWEGLPLALLEALAAGKPMVATAVGGNPEIVEDGVNGFIVPPRDPSALAAALARVASDGSFRAGVAQRNRAAFEARFSVEAMVETHQSLYAELTATPPRQGGGREAGSPSAGPGLSPVPR